MVSNKQKRAQLKLTRKIKADVREKGFSEFAKPNAPRVAPPGQALVNEAALAYFRSDEAPDYVKRGTYRDRRLVCVDCGVEETWTATQQKWWYEVAKGGVDSIATRCHPCRQKERERKEEARRVHLEGLAAKAARARD
jgi:hypothetical protein